MQDAGDHFLAQNNNLGDTVKRGALGFAVMRFCVSLCGFAVISILTRGIAVSKR